VRPERAGAIKETRRRSRHPAGALRAAHHCRIASQARRHGDHLHSCRGNFRSTFIASGGYDFVAEQLLGHTNFDGYFLEYDSDRAGGFEPLRFFPKGKKQLVLGLVTSKTGTLENKDEIKRRIDEATKYIALDQLCLSPQCGFASTEEGNILAEDEQWAKLKMIVELAEEVWG